MIRLRLRTYRVEKFYLTSRSIYDIILNVFADMSELADESDSKSDGKPCGFDPHYPHSDSRYAIFYSMPAFFIFMGFYK